MMGISATKVSEDFYSAAQIGPEDLAEIAAQGFKTVINCRPDGEGGAEQPAGALLQAAAEQQGLRYYYFPVTMGTPGVEHVAALSAAIASAPKPILGFCRSGMRAGNLYKASIEVSAKTT